MTPDLLLHRARALLERAPLIDGHNDLPMVVRFDGHAQGDVRRFGLDRRRAGDTDIPRLREGLVSAQFWAAFTPPDEPRPAGFALQQIEIVHAMIEAFPDDFALALGPGDVAGARNGGRIASFITIENGAALDGRLDALDAYYRLGVRLMTLCHNRSHDWCDSATDRPAHGGLSPFGERVVARMNDLGMIVDLSHASDAAARRALTISRAPVVFSHSNARALCDARRNIPDDILDLAAERSAMVMATFVPAFVGSPRAGGEPSASRGSLPQYCDHLDYLKGKLGPDRIGIGSDFFGGPQGEGLKDVACFPHIFAELLGRGWSEDDLEKLAGGNLLRLFREVEAARRPPAL